jgi:hypothetical protein
MSNSDAQAWLDLHVARAERFEGLFILTTLSALAALVALWKRPAWEKRLSWLTLYLSIVSFAASGWIAQAGGSNPALPSSATARPPVAAKTNH